MENVYQMMAMAANTISPPTASQMFVFWRFLADRRPDLFVERLALGIIISLPWEWDNYEMITMIVSFNYTR
jgi:hypothetical protein